MGAPRKNADSTAPRTRPATSPEEQEQLMVGLAVRQAQAQLEAGTASNQVLTHYLKIATVREQREREKLRLEAELLEARRDELNAAGQRSESAEAVLQALKSYRGEDEGEVVGEDPDLY